MNTGPNTTPNHPDLVTVTYRRANGSQATVIKPRKHRPVSKNYPRASTPSPAGRQAANRKRKADAWGANVLKMLDRQNADRQRKGY